ALAPSEALTVYGNVGTSFETPTTTELANQPSGATGFNPTLEPQRATNFEIGSRGDVTGRVHYSVALFDAEVRNELIGYQAPPPAAPGRVFFRNAGRSRHRGVELGAALEVLPRLTVATSWTYSDFRYTSYTSGTHVLDGRAIPGIPQHWVHVLVKGRPAVVRGGWFEVEETRSSGYFVNDTLSTYTGGWWTTNVRLGWNQTVGSVRLHPFAGFNNIWNRAYVGSVVINAAGGRYYEPAPGRNLYLGFSLGAGE
ncbi:MAG TPA: TonB-dependent receptor, partial [Gemmatimonadales bacterium]|nr:TonB-dependent receptor [Gemmatimonadales bacterium]